MDPTDMPNKPPKVFISYSHDSARHQARVLELSNRLREQGVHCEIDLYNEAPAEGWPRWMLNHVDEADYVLVICTETYERRFRGKEPVGKGRGAKWEGAVITQHLYDAEAHNTRFIPVLMDSKDQEHVPIVLRGATFYDVSTDDGYESLYRRLTTQPAINVPPVASSILRLPTTDITAERRAADAKTKSAEAEIEFNKNNFLAAVALCREAVKLVEDASNPELHRKIILRLTRALGQDAMSVDDDDVEFQKRLTEIAEWIDKLSDLGESKTVVALERAMLARIARMPEVALSAAEEALSYGDTDLTVQADALIARLQALWQLERADEGLSLVDEVNKVLREADDDPSVCLDASWIRTLCKTDKLDTAEIKRFVKHAEEIISRGTVSRDRLALICHEVESELGRANRNEDRLLLCDLAYLILEPLGNRQRLVLLLLESAELAAVTGDWERARVDLGRAELQAAQNDSSDLDPDEKSGVTFEAIRRFSRARILTRLADAAPSPAIELYREAHWSLIEAQGFALQNRGLIRGNADLFLAELHWWLGRTEVNLGRMGDAVTALHAVRSDAAMANSSFATQIAAKAWIMEAESLALSGRPAEAAETVTALINDPRLPDQVKNRPRGFLNFLSRTVRPTVDWLNSTDARAIQRIAMQQGLRKAVGDQFAPLLSWWREWQSSPGTPGPYSELFDVWGRGGFCRLAAAVRAKPHAAIAVDATSVDQIRNWARILCPLFETVIVKWKGELGSGIVIAPLHEAYGDGDHDFGGHGYAVTSDTFKDHPDWCAALSWANPLPQEVSRFLSDEALDLMKGGRLAVFPAPLVGCTQTAVGWTDNLLVETLLGGVVNVAKRSAPANERQRILDISNVQLPFIDNVSLIDLAKVLEETDAWVAPLRSLLLKSMSNDDLNYERWERISALEYDIQQACAELRQQLTTFARQHEGWVVNESGGSLTAAQREDIVAGHEPITGLLQSVAGARKELSPWIPFLRLQDYGGQLNWTCPLDNASAVPDQFTLSHLPVENGPELHTWLYPGTAGWTIPTAIRIPLE